MRVALAERLRPSDIEDEVGQMLAYYENQGLDVGRETVGAGTRALLLVPSPGAPRPRGSTYPWTDGCTG